MRSIALALALIAAPAAAQFNVPGLPGMFGLPGFTGLSVPAVLSSVNADGWSAIPITPASSYSPDGGSPVTTAVTRQGYDTSGNATTYVENITLTQRVRQAFPNYATLDTTGRTALSNWITTTDSGAFTNNSALVMPPPVATFISTDHALVTSTITVEFLAYHIMAHSQQPIPYASCTATDGTTTTSVVAATYVANLAGAYDLAPLAGFRAAITVSGLANAAVITVNCKAYPWAGNSSAILDSATSPTRGWFPQIYYRNTAAPTTYYVANPTATPNAGVDTNAGTSAAPFATIQRVFNVAGASGRDGLIINLKGDTASTGATITWSNATLTIATGVTNKAEVLIQPDPAAGGAITLNTGTSYVDFQTTWVRLKGLNIVRGSSQPLYSNNNAGPVGRIALENDVIDVSLGGGFKMGNNGRFALIGGSTIGYSTSPSYAPTTTFSVPLIRGHTITTPNGTTYNTVDQYIQVASKFTGITDNKSYTYFDYSGMVIAGMQYYGNGGVVVGIGDSTILNYSGAAIVDTLIETTSASNTTALAISNDPPKLTNVKNLIMWHITLAGAALQGRLNFLYDNNNVNACIGGTGSPNFCTVRTHTLFSVANNFFQELNNKGDVFVGVSGDTTDATAHIGSFAPYYGVGMRDNIYAYLDGAGGKAGVVPASSGNWFSQSYAGMNTYIGTAFTTATRTDLWTNYQGVTVSGGTYTAGAGNGGYTPCAVVTGTCTALSPALGWVKGPSLLPFTLGGVAIPTTNANAGAY